MLFRIELAGLLSLVCALVIVTSDPVVADDRAMIPSLEAQKSPKETAGHGGSRRNYN